MFLKTRLTSTQGLCHCTFCRKVSSSAFTVNTIVKDADFKVDGEGIKSYSTTSDSGNKLTNYFCTNCGSNLYSEGGFAGCKVVRMGLMDGDGLENAKPMLEVFAQRRVTWLKPVEGAADVEGMGNTQSAMA